jgi:hypothetical protein
VPVQADAVERKASKTSARTRVNLDAKRKLGVKLARASNVGMPHVLIAGIRVQEPKANADRNLGSRTRSEIKRSRSSQYAHFAVSCLSGGAGSPVSRLFCL